MTKQNFISMSLESGLKGIDGNGDIATLMALDSRGYFSTDLDLESDEEEMHELDVNFKPILHPLSDLTKEIDGAPAFFRYYGSDSPIKKRLVNLAYGIGDIDDVPFYAALRMIKEHFDIADLISKNQAININTLETNPYK